MHGLFWLSMLHLLIAGCLMLSAWGACSGECQEENDMAESQHSLLQRRKAKRGASVVDEAANESQSWVYFPWNSNDHWKQDSDVWIFQPNNLAPWKPFGTPQEVHQHECGGRAGGKYRNRHYRQNACHLVDKCVTVDQMVGGPDFCDVVPSGFGGSCDGSLYGGSCLKEGSKCFAGSIKMPAGITVSMFHLWGHWGHGMAPCTGIEDWRSRWKQTLSYGGNWDFSGHHDRVCAFKFELKEGWSCTNNNPPQLRPQQPWNSFLNLVPKTQPHLCLDISGGIIKEGRPLIVWPCTEKTYGPNEVAAQKNQVFGYANRRRETLPNTIHSSYSDAMCFNVLGGVRKGHAIGMWWCSGKAFGNEEWTFGAEEFDVIKLKSDPSLCIGPSVVQKGTPLQLTDCSNALKLNTKKVKYSRLAAKFWG